MSFLGAAWFKDGALLRERWGLLRLAIPAGMAMLGLILEDAYATPGRRSPLRLARGPLVGIGLALVLQGMFWARNPAIAVQGWIMFYGSAMSLLLSSALRVSFPPAADQLQGANAPAHWLKHASGSVGSSQSFILVAKSAAAIIAVAMIGVWTADYFGLPEHRVAMLLLLMFITYQLSKRR